MINTAILMGRITATPEVKHTASGVAVTSFTVACERAFAKDKVTDFIDVVAWRNTAEFIGKYFEKGQMIALKGTLQTRTYEDKNGSKHKITEVIADEVSFCGEKRQEEKTIAFKPNVSIEDDEEFETVSDEDLPF